MTCEDQHTDLKSLRTVTGKSADWADLAQTALNRPGFFGSMSQIAVRQLAKSLFSNGFFIGALVPNEPNLSQSMLDRQHVPIPSMTYPSSQQIWLEHT
jgi:hypothetical protein